MKPILYSALAALLFGLPVQAGMVVMQQLAYEFSQKNVEEFATWKGKEHLKAGADGLSFKAGPQNSVDLDLLLQPFAVGHGWRPAGHTGLTVNLEFNKPVDRYFAAYVRHSPDGVNWSSWLPAEQRWDVAKQGNDPSKVHVFNTSVGVPRRDMAVYRKKQREYGQMDVPWSSDEHAMCEWILAKDPDFFTHHRPFAGFIQVLVEGSIKGGQSLQSVKVNARTSTSGMQQVPKDPAAQKARKGNWNLWLVPSDEKNPACGFQQLFRPPAP